MNLCKVGLTMRTKLQTVSYFHKEKHRKLDFHQNFAKVGFCCNVKIMRVIPKEKVKVVQEIFGSENVIAYRHCALVIQHEKQEH